jgi:hypothetical protein
MSSLRKMELADCCGDMETPRRNRESFLRATGLNGHVPSPIGGPWSNRHWSNVCVHLGPDHRDI